VNKYLNYNVKEDKNRNNSESDKHHCIYPNNDKSEPSFDSNTLTSHQCREIVKLLVLVAGEGDRGGYEWRPDGREFGFLRLLFIQGVFVF